MLLEKVGALAVGSGLTCLALLLIAALFATDFPATSRIKAMPGYRALTGAYFTFGVGTVAFFMVGFAAIVFNIS